MRKVLAEIYDLVSTKTEAKGLEFDIKIEKEVPEYVTADKRRLLQILLNLLYNSVKYTFTGKIRLRVERSTESTLAFIVEDTGIGMHSEELKMITKLFGLVDQKSSKEQTGIGLGLAVTSQIVNAMSGKLEINSKPDVGTSCTVILPLKESFPITSIHTEHGKLTRKVLVVDDDPLVQLAVGAMLTKLGCTVSKAGNGGIALQIVRESNKTDGGKFDFILMDANMPVMNGYEATKLIREEQGIVQVPIVCISAQDSKEHSEKCYSSGMSSICNVCGLLIK